MTSWQINRTFLLIFAGFFLVGGSHLSAQNLVTNGGFESGLTGWTNGRSGSGSASFSLETSLQYEGTNALKTVVNNPGADIWNVETRGPTLTNLGTGQSVSITFRARAATAGAKLRAVLQTTTYRQSEFTLNTAWTRYTWNFTSVETSPQFKFQYRTAGTVWIDQVSVVANAAAGTTTRISSDTTIRHQTMDGIGGSIAFNTPDYEALSATKKNEIENLLYVNCGIDIVRLRTGNSDALNNELAMRAQRNGAKSLLACWSPPASLKSNNSIVSGTLRIVSGKYDYAGFADWWYARLSASNWMHDFISIQNEPSFDPGDKETCRFFANETVPATTSGSASYRLAMDSVYNKIKNEPKRPQFIAVDAENHSAFNSIAPTVSGLSYVNHLGFHNYGTNDFAGVKSRYNGNRGWMTEWGADPDILNNWLVLATNIHETLVNANASAYLAWRMVHGNNTGQFWAMIGVDNGQYQVQNSFYSVKHFAKHISSGDQRIEVTNSGINANLRVSGYLNAAGNKISLIVLNTGGTDDVISLRFPGLPVGSVTAFRTRQFDIGSSAYNPLGAVNIANNQTISKNSITSYVVNLTETLNPYDPSLLRVNGFLKQGNQFSLAIPAQPGHNFILWKSSSLANGSWQEVTNAVRAEIDGQLYLTDPNTGTARAFYRVERDTGL
jgi:O-glycosyl hydrolase